MKFTVIDYYNKDYDYSEDIWNYSIAVTDYEVDVAVDDTLIDIIAELINVGYLLEIVTSEDVCMEWLEPNMIEFYARDSYEPLFRLEAR